MTRFGRDLLDGHVELLRRAGVPSPEVDVRWLARAVLERGGGVDDLDELVRRRATREPLQVVLGETWFRNVRVGCAPGVFIPRPETEVVAGVAVDHLLTVAPERRRVVEPCTGSGAISCALVTEVADVEVMATELSPVAAELAARNLAEALTGDAGVPAAPGARGQVRRGDLLESVDADWQGTVEVLVSNPPYLPAADRGTWDAEVAGNDPDLALVGGEHGNEVVDRLLELATTWLAPGGLVVLELDPRLAGDAAETARRLGLQEVSLVRDLTGRDRAVRATVRGRTAAPAPRSRR